MGESMKKRCGIAFTLPLVITMAACQKPQESASENAPLPAGSENDRPLVLIAAIPLEAVKGRFDHFSSAKGLLFVSALGNNSEEIIDLAEGALAHTIKGAVGTLGATAAFETALRLETMGRQGDLSLAAEAIAALDEEHTEQLVAAEEVAARDCRCASNSRRRSPWGI